MDVRIKLDTVFLFLVILTTSTLVCKSYGKTPQDVRKGTNGRQLKPEGTQCEVKSNDCDKGTTCCKEGDDDVYGDIRCWVCCEDSHCMAFQKCW